MLFEKLEKEIESMGGIKVSTSKIRASSPIGQFKTDQNISKLNIEELEVLF